MRQQFQMSEADELAIRAARRLRTALALHETGVAMKRAQLRRQDQAASDAEISRRVSVWLRTRQDAPYGDAEGIARLTSEEP
jgi:hypothetical protein